MVTQHKTKEKNLTKENLLEKTKKTTLKKNIPECQEINNDISSRREPINCKSIYFLFLIHNALNMFLLCNMQTYKYT